jgi:phosphatidate cytidylyltransferase
MGAVLIGLVIGVLFGDRFLAPWSPFLLLLVLALSLPACHEFLQLLPSHCRPFGWFSSSAVVLLILTNWLPTATGNGGNPWQMLASVFGGIVLAGFVIEMRFFQPQDGAVMKNSTEESAWVQRPVDGLLRLGLTILLVAYLGLLPSFLIQLRWPPADDGSAPERKATTALALAIFVPKCCDIGAYFTGRFLGRHKMAMTLSPKKTWEGAAGGIAASVLASYGIERGLGPALPGAALLPLGFGATIGITGIVGDLAESFIKRACTRKDASAMMPGFGGVLDVVDSILFSAPVAFWWLR